MHVNILDGPKEMSVKGLTCTLNMPQAIKTILDEDGNEKVAGLPPYNERPAFPVDEYPACPSNWMHGSDMAGSYFVPVVDGRGLWLDFNGCTDHDHHVAAVISIQGINPISGQKQDEMVLEQYKNKCPVHDKDFQQDRFCSDCGYKWPAQNYISTNGRGMPSKHFWLDGFRSQDGRVQQYLFTHEELRGVANQVIGKDRVFAIGVAFFLSKEAKPKPKMEPQNKGIDTSGDGEIITYSSFYSTNNTSGVEVNTISARGAIMQNYADMQNHAESPVFSQSSILRAEVREVQQTQHYEVGAGAAIKQQVYEDPENVDFWKNEPEAFLYVNYVCVEDAVRILESGKRNEKALGFMDGLKVGN